MHEVPRRQAVVAKSL